jgi:hypothetical protein
LLVRRDAEDVVEYVADGGLFDPAEATPHLVLPHAAIAPLALFDVAEAFLLFRDWPPLLVATIGSNGLGPELVTNETKSIEVDLRAEYGPEAAVPRERGPKL